jgi:hypothetical protein
LAPPETIANRARRHHQTFLGLISLQNGTEVITLTLIFNKLTGFYGILAILTGYSLSALQLSMYIYSLAVLLLLLVFLPHIRKQTPFEVLGLAWLYLIDTFLNAAYTTTFALAWFANSTALDRHAGPSGEEPPSHPGVPAATLAQGIPVMPDVPKTTKHIGPEESWTSLAVIVLVTVIRLYFAVVVMSYASQVLSRQRDLNGWEPESSKVSEQAVFAPGSVDGEGWRGRIGRKMLGVGRSYWLDERAQEEWAKNVSSKFRSAAAQV